MWDLLKMSGENAKNKLTLIVKKNLQNLFNINTFTVHEVEADFDIFKFLSSDSRFFSHPGTDTFTSELLK